MPEAKEPDRSGSDARDPAVFGDHGQRERLPPDRPGLSDPRQEAQVFRAATEGDVLAVVRRRVGITFTRRQRLDCASERGTGFQDGDLVPRFGEVERRGETGEAAADHDGFHSAATARSFPTVESCGRCEKTS